MRLKKIDWQVAVAYVGTVVGAGFASGQELMQFFVKFGYLGIWGGLISGFLFAFLGGIIIHLARGYGFYSYKDLLGMRLSPQMVKIIDGIMMLFLFSSLSIMFSGSGALYKELLNLPVLLGVFLTMILVFISLLNRSQGFLWFNSLLVPVLVIIMLVVILGVFKGGWEISKSVMNSFLANLVEGRSWLVSALLYISYNMISSLVVLTALAHEQKDSSFIGGVFGGLILCALSLGLVMALLIMGERTFYFQIPMLYLAHQVHTLLFYLYGIVLWGAMLTTAMANAYGLCRRLELSWNMPYFMILIIILTLALPFSLYDFSKLISQVYPIFGYLGLIIIFLILGEGYLYCRQSLTNWLKNN